MLKYIPQSWKNDMRVNFAHKHDFYINPRGRVFPALTSTGVSYVKNDASDNMRGTYRVQTDATTDLTYLYTMSQSFIVEGWFRPEFAFDVTDDQTIFQCGDAAEFSIVYNATTDTYDMIQSPGTTLSTSAFTSNIGLHRWTYIRAFYDNSAKLAGLYVTVESTPYSDSQNVPGSGDFVPLNTVSFLPTVAADSSYWIIHELDETLPTGEYKTYQADRQIIFDFNGTTLGRERIRIPVVHTPTDTRGVTSFSLSRSVENPMTGSAGANTAVMKLLNVNGQFSDDQYDAFDPFNGRYNGTQKYLQNRVQVEIDSEYYVSTDDYLYPALDLYPSETLYPMGPLNTSNVEPLFIGRTTPGAFKRSSPNKLFGDVSISIEDGISELGETKLRRAYAFDSYDLCDPVAESDSLVHSIARLVTKKEIRNYALNSSFENATIANSWTNSGMTTFARSNTYAQFGTYSMQCVADAAGDKVNQVIKFETADLIDVGDVFNFSAFIRQGTASTVKIQIEELTSAGELVGTASETACGTDTAVFARVNVSRTILSSTCTQLRITFYAVAASTFYVDGVMLTRGIDPIDYFLLNATDGASGSGSADLASTVLYDTVAFDCDAVNVEHPYALVEKGQTAWDALKKIGDASIASYIGMSPDGVFNFKTRYNSDDMPNMGDIEDFGGIATSLDVQGANAVKVHGVIIDKEANPTTLWTASSASGFLKDEGSLLKHPITNASYLTVSGANTIEMKYKEDV